MKKLYSIPQIIAGIINIVMIILIWYFFFTSSKIVKEPIWLFILGIWAGWNNTRSYYKNNIKKMQSNTQNKERK